MTHSKGEWKIGNGWGNVVTDNSEGFPENTGHSDTDYYGGYLIAESIAKDADAKLIAAAPDLLEALENIIGDIFECVHPDDYKKCKAAIKKATE